ncbi:hypothetical protein [Kribbella sp. NPDC006257]|uniref:hypothetical protein n=1 Tax=Kribbella sp. NPDC006257 TaxID=3156738 RepID=UPI0033A1E936
MFPIEFADCDAAETLARVEAAHARQRQCELDQILLAQHYAALHPVPTHNPGLPGGERAHVYGGEGCPRIAEFAPAEYGAVTGVSAFSAARFLGQCVALPARFPLTWQRVLTGHATAWKARQLAQDCVTLSLEAASIVDHRVADIIDTVTGPQLATIKKTAIWDADPEAARAKAEAEAKERGVWVGRTDNHGSTTLFIKACTGGILSLNATITQLAEALAATGDTSTLDHRRAKAATLLADPDLATDLLTATHHLPTTNPASSTDPAPTSSQPAPTTEPPASTEPAPTTEPPASTEPASASHNPPGTNPTGTVSDQTRQAHHTSQPGPDYLNRPHQFPEPGPNDEADRDTPPPNAPHHPLDSTTAPVEPAAHHATRADAAPLSDLTEPRAEAEADRDTPPPNTPPPNTPDHPLDQAVALPATPNPHHPPSQAQARRAEEPPRAGEPPRRGEPPAPVDNPAPEGMDAAARLELRRKLETIRRDPANRGRRTFQTVLTIHITDETLRTGQGIARIEGYGPVYTHQLEELLGHHRIVVRPVNDLNTPISVHSYEIPDRLRDQINLRYPIEQFPYGTTETTTTTDLDHIQPYHPANTEPQTRTDNLNPLRRYNHRLKTHGAWNVRRITRTPWNGPPPTATNSTSTTTAPTPSPDVSRPISVDAARR